MSDKLVFNPYLLIHFDRETDTDFLLFAPLVNEGLQILRLRESENKPLFEKVSKFFRIGFKYLEIEKDLTFDEIELFKEYAILVSEDYKIEKPLFSCQLDEVEITEEKFEFRDLIVNPTFRFEPLNLLNFRDWINEKHLSPHQPTVWIKTPVAGIDIGYWLNPQQANIIPEFVPGKLISNDIDEETLAKLVSAQILVTKKSLSDETNKWQDKIEKARRQFIEEKYVSFGDILPKAQIRALATFYKKHISQGFMEFGDEQVENRYRQHNEPLARYFHYNFTKLMSLIADQEVRPSYCYAASYKNEANLKPHRDRAQCEYSISFQVDYDPLPENQISPWAIEFAEPFELKNENIVLEWKEFEAYSDHIKKTSAINLRCGEGIFYRGPKLIHYRRELPAGHNSTSLFFHYVTKDFEDDLQ